MLNCNLKAIREQKCITQEKLARNADITTRTVQKIESGENATIMNIIAILKVLKIKFDDLYQY